MQYAVIIEKVGSNFGAYVPDLPGCIATGDSIAEVETLIREAIEFHIEGMREDGQTPPLPNAVTLLVEAA
jgi:predicted RNase H-like HicB family nuclease